VSKESSHLHTLSSKYGLIFKSQKKTKRALIKRASSEDNNEMDYLEKWFLGNQEIIADYYDRQSGKAIISPKFLSMEWLKEVKFDEVRDIMKF